MKFHKITTPLIALTLCIAMSCSVRYSLSGASIAPDVKTVQVDYFPNMAAMVAPILSPTLTDGLTTAIQRQTRLQFTNEDPDVYFSGQIIDYRSEPVSISAGEYAQENRLTIAVRVTFINNRQPELSFDNRTFTAYANFDSNQMLTSVEGQLIPEITALLVDDIFNAAFSNW